MIFRIGNGVDFVSRNQLTFKPRNQVTFKPRNQLTFKPNFSGFISKFTRCCSTFDSPSSVAGLIFNNWSLNPVERRGDNWTNITNLKMEEVEDESEEQLKTRFVDLRARKDTGLLHLFSSLNRQRCLSISVLSEAMQCLASIGYPETAISLIAPVVKKGWNLNSPVYIALIQGFLNKNDDDGVLYVYSRIPQSKALDIHGLVFPTLCRMEKYPESVRVLRELGPYSMIEHCLVLNSLFLNKKIDGYMLLAYMLRIGMRPTYSCFKDFIQNNSITQFNHEVQAMIKYLMETSRTRFWNELVHLYLTAPPVRRHDVRPKDLALLDFGNKNKSSRNIYHFVVGNAKSLLEGKEHWQDQLAARMRRLEKLGMERDFWLVIEPKFLDKFPKIASMLERPVVALVSTNILWIKSMEPTLDCVLSDSYVDYSPEKALASSPDNWVTPYPEYESGWWEPFLPVKSECQTAQGSLECDDETVYSDDESAEVARLSLRVGNEQESISHFKAELESHDGVSSNKADVFESSSDQSVDVEKSNIGTYAERDSDFSPPVCQPYEGKGSRSSTNNVYKPAETE